MPNHLLTGHVGSKVKNRRLPVTSNVISYKVYEAVISILGNVYLATSVSPRTKERKREKERDCEDGWPPPSTLFQSLIVAY